MEEKQPLVGRGEEEKGKGWKDREKRCRRGGKSAGGIREKMAERGCDQDEEEEVEKRIGCEL